MAGIKERGLSDSVILWEEVEFNLGSNLSGEIVGIVFQSPIRTNSDLDRRSHLSIDSLSIDSICREGESGEGIGELHSDIIVN